MKYRIAQLRNGRYLVQYQDERDDKDNWWNGWEYKFYFMAKWYVRRKQKEAIRDREYQLGMQKEKIIEEFEI